MLNVTLEDLTAQFWLKCSLIYSHVPQRRIRLIVQPCTWKEHCGFRSWNTVPALYPPLGVWRCMLVVHTTSPPVFCGSVEGIWSYLTISLMLGLDLCLGVRIGFLMSKTSLGENTRNIGQFKVRVKIWVWEWSRYLYSPNRRKGGTSVLGNISTHSSWCSYQCDQQKLCLYCTVTPVRRVCWTPGLPFVSGSVHFLYKMIFFRHGQGYGLSLRIIDDA